MKFYSLSVPVALVLSTCLAQAQVTCLPDGITFRSQAELNDFPTQYPGCTAVLGSVRFVSGSGLTDLLPFAQVARVDGDLVVDDNIRISSLAGLENVSEVGGSLLVSRNMALTSLEGLAGLTRVGGDLEISALARVADLQGLDALTYVGGNFALNHCATVGSLQGLGALDTIGGDLVIGSMGQLLTTGHAAPAHIGGGVELVGILGLTDLLMLRDITSLGGGLTIAELRALTDLDDLEDLASIDGPLELSVNMVLADISGISNIDPAGITDLTIRACVEVTDCAVASVCGYLQADPAAPARIENNAGACASRAQVEEACGGVGIAERSAVAIVALYPNPASTWVIVELHPYAAATHYRLLDATGRVVNMGRIPAGSMLMQLDVAALVPGLYALEAGGAVQRFVKD